MSINPRPLLQVRYLKLPVGTWVAIICFAVSFWLAGQDVLASVWLTWFGLLVVLLTGKFRDRWW